MSVIFSVVGFLSWIWQFQCKNGTAPCSLGHTKAASLAVTSITPPASATLAQEEQSTQPRQQWWRFWREERVGIFRRKRSGSCVVIFYTFCKIWLQATGKNISCNSSLESWAISSNALDISRRHCSTFTTIEGSTTLPTSAAGALWSGATMQKEETIVHGQHYSLLLRWQILQCWLGTAGWRGGINICRAPHKRPGIPTSKSAIQSLFSVHALMMHWCS